MAERPNDNLKKQDLDLILEVNAKAIQVQSEVFEQNEEVIDSLNQIKKVQVDQEKKIDKLVSQSEEHHRDLFRIQVLFITGLMSLVIQIIQIFLKK